MKVRFKRLIFANPTDGTPMQYFYIETKRHCWSPWHARIDHNNIPELHPGRTLERWKEAFKGWKIINK